MNPAESVSTGVAHDNINSLIGNGNNLNQRQDENFIIDALQKFAYNISGRSMGRAYMNQNLPELIKMGFTPIEKDYLDLYTGGDEFKSGQLPDLLSLYLNQKSPAESGFKEQKLRPTEISERFKKLPTYSVKHHTKEHPLDAKREIHTENATLYDYAWDENALEKISNLKKGEVVKIPHHSVGIINNLDLGEYTVSAGKDNKGTYVSIYDTWDFGPGYGRSYVKRGPSTLLKEMQPTLMNMIGNPFAIYDRYYIPQEKFKSELQRRKGELQDWELKQQKMVKKNFPPWILQNP
jgi:hypothetical protein